MRCVYLNVSKGVIPSRVHEIQVRIGNWGNWAYRERERWEAGRYRYHPSSLLSLEGMMIREK